MVKLNLTEDRVADAEREARELVDDIPAGTSLRECLVMVTGGMLALGYGLIDVIRQQDVRIAALEKRIGV